LNELVSQQEEAPFFPERFSRSWRVWGRLVWGRENFLI